MTPKNAERCERCGKFVPDLHRALKAEVDALLGTPDPGVGGQYLGPGTIAAHTPSGFAGRVISISYDRRATLKDPTGQTVVVPFDELQALGSVGAQPVPGGAQGSFSGRPALQSDITPGQPYALAGKAQRQPAAGVPLMGPLAKAECPNCGADLSWDDLNARKCPRCGADIKDSDVLAEAGKTAAGYYASPQGMLKLARGILRNTRQPGALFGRSSSIPVGMRKGLSFVRGERVKNRRTGAVGHVLQCGGGTAAVEYKTARGTAMTMEKVAELERV
jgi:hypothetical protein